MFFNNRKKYNGKVAALLPEFGITLEEAGIMKTANVLDIAWDKRYNEHEGALYVAFLVFSGYVKNGTNNKQLELIRNINSVMSDWLDKGIVSAKLANAFTEKSLTWVKSANKATVKEFEFLPGMPDIMQSEPIRTYTLDRYLLVLLEDLPCVAEQLSGEELPLRFLYTMVVIDTITNNPHMFVTLETGSTQFIHMCIISASGDRKNLGNGSVYKEILDFENAAIEIICPHLNIDRKLIKKTSG